MTSPRQNRNILPGLDEHIENCFGFPRGLLEQFEKAKTDTVQRMITATFQLSPDEVSQNLADNMLHAIRRRQQIHELLSAATLAQQDMIRHRREEAVNISSQIQEEKEAILFAYEVTERFDNEDEMCREDCSICLEPILQDAITYFQYNCGHALHSHCAKQWFYTNTSPASCPNCRKVYTL